MHPPPRACPRGTRSDRTRSHRGRVARLVSSLRSAGQWRAALRCRYRGLVAELAGRPRPRRPPRKDDRRGARRVAGPRRHLVEEQFRALTALFDDAWYGDAPTGPTEAARLAGPVGGSPQGRGQRHEHGRGSAMSVERQRDERGNGNEHAGSPISCCSGRSSPERCSPVALVVGAPPDDGTPLDLGAPPARSARRASCSRSRSSAATSSITPRVGDDFDTALVLRDDLTAGAARRGHRTGSTAAARLLVADPGSSLHPGTDRRRHADRVRRCHAPAGRLHDPAARGARPHRPERTASSTTVTTARRRASRAATAPS